MTKTMNNDTLWSYSYTDDSTVTITTSDSVLSGDYVNIDIGDCDSTFTLDDVTIGFGDYYNSGSKSITVGNTKLNEDDVKDILAIAGMIKDMPDGSGIKKLFNTHRAMKSLGDTQDGDSETN